MSVLRPQIWGPRVGTQILGSCSLKKEKEEVKPPELEFVGPTPVESRSDVPPFATQLAPNAYFPHEDDDSVVSVVNRVLMRKSLPLPTPDVNVKIIMDLNI
ncbi:unnamed protein product [Orchesella dallaii]|uniref:Uncharacterized protein n=1 Tax=Orchesella dallaii TaxID=48710 RepID=A0ABP1S925_9HEXA